MAAQPSQAPPAAAEPQSNAAAWRRRFAEACERLESKHLRIQELEEASQEAQNAAEAAEVRLADALDGLAKETSSRAQLLEELAESQRCLAETRSRLVEAESRLEDTTARLTDTAARLADTAVRLDDTVKQREDTAKRLAETVKRLDEAQQQLDGIGPIALALARLVSRTAGWFARAVSGASTALRSAHRGLLGRSRPSSGSAGAVNEPLPLQIAIDPPHRHVDADGPERRDEPVATEAA